MVLTGLHTALGVRHAPYRMKERTDGVYDGASAVLTPEFLRTVGATVAHVHLQKKVPAEAITSEYAHLIAAESKKAARLIHWNDEQHLKYLVVGGDHSLATASLLALEAQTRFSKVGYIQLDAHADLNTFASSPTGNYHGMHVRVLCDTVGQSELDSLFARKIPYSHLLYVGNLDLDPEERKFMKEKKILCLPVTLQNPLTIEHIQKLQQFCRRFEHIHLSLDIDGLDEHVAPATGIPCVNGVSLLDAESVCHVVAATAHSLSADVVEVNPEKNGSKVTCTTARHLITALLRKSI